MVFVSTMQGLFPIASTTNPFYFHAYTVYEVFSYYKNFFILRYFLHQDETIVYSILIEYFFEL